MKKKVSTILITITIMILAIAIVYLLIDIMNNSETKNYSCTLNIDDINETDIIKVNIGNKNNKIYIDTLTMKRFSDKEIYNTKKNVYGQYNWIKFDDNNYIISYDTYNTQIKNKSIKQVISGYTSNGYKCSKIDKSDKCLAVLRYTCNDKSIFKEYSSEVFGTNRDVCGTSYTIENIGLPDGCNGYITYIKE